MNRPLRNSRRSDTSTRGELKRNQRACHPSSAVRIREALCYAGGEQYGYLEFHEGEGAEP